MQIDIPIIHESPFLKTLINAATTAGEKLMQGFHEINTLSVSKKSTHPNDILTTYDHLIQRIAIDCLKEDHPTFKIIGEESEEKFPVGWNKGYTWIIDPIDGTLNFRYGRKEFAISIALFNDGEPLAGVVYAPARYELYYAEKGKGAYLNDKRLNVRATPITTTPLCHFELNKIEDEDFFSKVRPLATSITQCGGSAALDLAFTAAGLNDSVLSTNLSLWDIAAGILLIQEAGGIVLTPHGKTDVIKSGEGQCSHLAGHPDTVTWVLQHLPNQTVSGVVFGCD